LNFIFGDGEVPEHKTAIRKKERNEKKSKTSFNRKQNQKVFVLLIEALRRIFVF
jgi:hypothetical protein